MAVVSRLLEEGYRVTGLERSERKLSHVRDGGAEALLADISTATDVEERIRPLFDRGASILVNCAAVLGTGDIEDIDPKLWNEVLAVNLTGTYLLCRAAIPGMRQRKFGRIVNFSSIGGQSPARSAGVHYSAAKAGVIGLSRTLASQVAGDGITVNVVAPGRIKTPMFYSAHRDPEARQGDVPVGRLGNAEEVASTVSYLVSDGSGFMTGATLDVNGGALMR